MELFLKNCGISSLEVVVARDAVAAPDRRRFEKPYLLIGRDELNDVVLDDPAVSRRHAYVQAVGGRVLVVDLGSRGGVHWPSGPKISDWLDRSQSVRLGGASVLVSPPRPAAGQGAAVPRRTQASRPDPPVVVEVTGGAPCPARWSMNRPVALVGTAEACKVRLRGDGVSRFHCSLVRGPLGVWAVDLLSRDGTRVNGEMASCARLEDGTRLQVGAFVLRVWYEASGESPTPHLLPTIRRAVMAPQAVAPPAVADQSLLLPVINEFNLMQQQMLDQFHQTMLMMAEMFTTLHREQTGLVREELEHLRRLTQELTTLQMERARQAVEAPAAAATSLVLAAPAANRQPVQGGQKTTAGELEAGGHATESPKTEDKANGSEKRPAAATVGPAPAEVHDWISRRIVALQEERQGRWQKLLQFVTGGRGG